MPPEVYQRYLEKQEQRRKKLRLPSRWEDERDLWAKDLERKKNLYMRILLYVLICLISLMYAIFFRYA
ncbi:hypothetical protein [Nonlabens dokdonensis]|uniref:hypothetical protein n=1 Tax=Nonlabens dokdonensis TaxID=328515 RepID=UPI0026F1BA3E|nr:hypothetical protein [Nonlabens dokdonensis]